MAYIRRMFIRGDVSRLAAHNDIVGLEEVLADTQNIESATNAADALGRIGNPQALDALLSAFNRAQTDDDLMRQARDPDSYLHHVITALGQLRDSRAVQPLVRLFEMKRNGSNQGLAAHILAALANIGGQSVFTVLRDYLESDRERTLAVVKEGRGGDLGSMLLAAKEGHYSVYHSGTGYALHALSAMCVAGDARAVEAAISFAALQTENWTSDSKTADIVAQIGRPAVKRLAYWLHEGNSRQRQLALLMLQRISLTEADQWLIGQKIEPILPTKGSPKAGQLLTQRETLSAYQTAQHAFPDPDEENYHAVLASLHRLTAERSVQGALVRALESPRLYIICDALDILGETEAVHDSQALLAVLDRDTRPHVRERVVRVLGGVKDPKAVTLLEALYAAADDRLRFWINDSLFRLTAALPTKTPTSRSATEVLPEDRRLRVFISSTFNDMQAEREALVKQTFPSLDTFGDDYGVQFVPVDLRWGVTSEENSLEESLKEVDRSDVVVCLLGARYGYIPPNYTVSSTDLTAWLKKQPAHLSITDLEIRRAQDKNKPLILCLRTASPNDVSDHTTEQEKLRKQASSGALKCLEQYTQPQEAARFIETQLRALATTRFEAAKFSPLARHQAAFLRQQAVGYLSRPEVERQLSEGVSRQGSPILITGEAGAGKSALLANWGRRYRDAHPEACVILYFPDSSSPTVHEAAEKLLQALNDSSVRVSPKEDPRPLLESALRTASVGGKPIVLVVDALDQIVTSTGKPSLNWLPDQLPPGVQMITAAADDTICRQAETSGWRLLPLRPLTPSERGLLAQRYLDDYGKSLTDKQLADLIRDPQTGNPLYLRTLLNELRVFGNYEGLEAQLQICLRTPNVETLFSLLIRRWQKEFDSPPPGMVAEALRLLWATPDGIQIDMLRSLSVVLPEGIPQWAVKSPRNWPEFFLALRPHLLDYDGNMRLAHNALRHAIMVSGLLDPAALQRTHQRLGNALNHIARPVEQRGEAAYYLFAAGSWDHLRRLLTDEAVMLAWWRRDPYAVRHLWQQIEARGALHLTQVYAGAAAAPRPSPVRSRVPPTSAPAQGIQGGRTSKQHSEFILMAADLLIENGHIHEGQAMRQMVTQTMQDSGNLNGLADVQLQEAGVLLRQGQFDAAAEIVRQAASIYQRTNNPHGQANVQLAMGNIALHRSQLQVALDHLLQAEKLYRTSVDDPVGLGSVLTEQAAARRMLGHPPEESERLLDEATRLYETIGNHQGLLDVLAEQGRRLMGVGDLPGAAALFERGATYAGRYNLLASQAYLLTQQARALDVQGQDSRALELLEQTQTLSRRINAQVSLIDSLYSAALIYLRRENSDKFQRFSAKLGKSRSLELLEEADALALSMGLVSQRISILLGKIYYWQMVEQKSRSAEALAEAKRLVEIVDTPTHRLMVLMAEMQMLVNDDRNQEALAFAQQIEQQAQAANQQVLLAIALYMQVILYRDVLKQTSRARQIAQRAFPLLKQAGMLAPVEDVRSLL